MKFIQDKLKTPASGTEPERVGSGPYRKSQRRKRSLYRTVRRRLRNMLGRRQFGRLSLVLLLLVGFVYISFANVLMSPQRDTPEASRSVRSAATDNLPTESYAEALDLSTGSQVGYQSDNQADYQAEYQAGKEPVIAVSTNSARNVSKAAIHTVNEGGSLWRTARRFITDEVVIDRLIDSLEDNGMDVRRVKAGFEFIVNDLGSEGLLVIVEEGGKTYESRVFADSVTTSVQRQSGNGTDLSRTASLGQ